MPLVLQETLRAVFYAPFYAAIALGAYEQEGLDIRLTRAAKPANPPPASSAARSTSPGAGRCG